MAHLSLNNLEKTYGGGFKAVHGINLEVKDGEFMVLVGPSGCAKSTTLRMIAGLEDVTGGEIRIGDRIVNALQPGKRDIAMVFQNYALYPHMKVRSNLSFGLRLQRKSKAEIAKATADVARILEIEPLLDRLPKQLSGGQAQRVALGRALIKKPEVFLFDEPLSNLDAKLRASMRVRITDLHKRLKAEGMSSTVVYVTHDQTEAMTMGDRICVMQSGHIMQVATPKELYNKPANLFVATFIGSPEMNIIEGAVQGNEFHTKGQSIALDAALLARLGARPRQAALGIRPQHLRLVPEGTGLKATIRSVEFMGHEVYVHALLDGTQITVVVSAAEFEALGEGASVVHLRPDAEWVHIFDRESGQNVSLLAQG
ncbi:sn-glycerol-3-phosphate import ATP-binding protein UgpC [Aquimixticola soesokkakensis]|uniref:sn-glycerol-3-phosphate import ATP-binding protein UgpC n=1 Tax=Aquimixticola soesokkakensis TaxID=1519096 RepID=A0A1Y5RV84_9RHOB|nr:sn-glycerol-3-phosphate ABC transporter ATP-binding protein UgpC [Aquimixticola soesokkakensis]SLN23515.1 sn-glycerol-3-phosphate import ATP-binding protein UgpC [Aquimixticola soesokkakensis]